MRAQVDTTQKRKNKIKLIIKKRKRKRKPYANIIQGCKMLINNNKEDLRQENCCLSQIC